jgi:hypothetical protein
MISAKKELKMYCSFVTDKAFSAQLYRNIDTKEVCKKSIFSDALGL